VAAWSWANEFFKKTGVIVSPAAIAGTQMGGWFRKEINTDGRRSLGTESFVSAALPAKLLQKVGGGAAAARRRRHLSGARRRSTIDERPEWVGPMTMRHSVSRSRR